MLITSLEDWWEEGRELLGLFVLVEEEVVLEKVEKSVWEEGEVE